jgi:hypothetical protein
MGGFFRAMNRLILYIIEHVSEETQAQIIFVASSVVIGLIANLIAGAIMRFMLRW